MPTWLKCFIALSAAAAVYVTGVATAGWSTQWVSAVEARSSDNGHRGGTFCPSDSRLKDIFQVELRSSVDRIERHTVNSCEYGWAMVHVTVVRSGRKDSCMILLRYDYGASQWYDVSMHWLASSGGSGVAV